MVLKRVVLPAPLRPTTETNSPSWTWSETDLERLGLAVLDAEGFDLEEGGLVLEAGFGAGGGGDGAAEVDPADGFVGHDLVGGAFGDRLAEIHGEGAVDEGGDGFHVVVDEEDGVAVVAEAADEVGEGGDLGGGEAGEGFVDEDDRRVAGESLGELEAAEVGEGEGGGAAVEDGGEADAAGDDAGAGVDCGVGEEAEEAVGEEGELDVLEDGLAVEGAGVLEDQADAEARDAVGGLAGKLGAAEADAAGGGGLDAHDELHHGGFAGAVGADQA